MPSAVLPTLASSGSGVCPASHTSSTRKAAAVRMMAPTLNGPCTSSSTSADATRRCAAASLGAAASCRCRRAASRRPDLEHAVARPRAAAVDRPALGLQPAVERVGAEVLLHDEDGPSGGRQPAEPACRAARAARPCRCGSAGSTTARRRPGPPAPRPRRRPRTLARPRRSALRPAQVEGPLVHVDRPHRRRGRAPGQRARDRRRSRSRGRPACPPTAGAGPSSRRCFVPVSIRSGENTPRSVASVSDRSGRSSRISCGADRLDGFGSK